MIHRAQLGELGVELERKLMVGDVQGLTESLCQQLCQAPVSSTCGSDVM